MDAGTVPSLLKASAMAAADDDAGKLPAPIARPVG